MNFLKSRLHVGVVGCGVVGTALLNYLDLSTNVKVYLCDPPRGYNDSLSALDAAFVSVPVNMGSDNEFVHDESILEECIERIGKSVPIFIRSTVLPGTCDRLARKYNRTIIHMPEFLTERRASQDFRNHDQIAAGLLSVAETDHAARIFALLAGIFPDKDIVPVQNDEAELGKYFHNVLAASKVSVANIFYGLAREREVSYAAVKRVALISGLINDEHLKVPGPDGKLGFGGKCFPKDLEAIMSVTRKMETHGVLSAIAVFNDMVRPS